MQLDYVGTLNWGIYSAASLMWKSNVKSEKSGVCIVSSNYLITNVTCYAYVSLISSVSYFCVKISFL